MSNRYDSAKAYFNSVTGENHGAFADAADAYYKYVLANGVPAGSVAWNEVTGKPAVIAAGADAATARAAIGAGTSNLALGTTATTALAGNYTPPAATTSVAGVVKEGVAVANTTDSTTIIASFNSLLASLRTAGVIAAS